DFNLTYSDTDIANIVENTIRVYRYNGTSAQWILVPTSTVDTANNVVRSGNITSFSLFAPFGSVAFNQCGEITGTGIITQNITSAGTCFNVTGPAEVTCEQGVEIHGDTTGSAFQINNTRDVLIRDCLTILS
ncbi:hypothetical protein J4457_07325, partial [Candidatus Woesearchaeota archaeon]|nr:hypothetical protein [Candidatus Woesearchaeota archaeon]